MVREWVAGKTVCSCCHGPYLSALAMGLCHTIGAAAIQVCDYSPSLLVINDDDDDDDTCDLYVLGRRYRCRVF